VIEQSLTSRGRIGHRLVVSGDIESWPAAHDSWCRSAFGTLRRCLRGARRHCLAAVLPPITSARDERRDDGPSCYGPRFSTAKDLFLRHPSEAIRAGG
jgi:hypothetical protein